MRGTSWRCCGRTGRRWFFRDTRTFAKRSFTRVAISLRPAPYAVTGGRAPARVTPKGLGLSPSAEIGSSGATRRTVSSRTGRDDLPEHPHDVNSDRAALDGEIVAEVVVLVQVFQAGVVASLDAELTHRDPGSRDDRHVDGVHVVLDVAG